MPMDELEREVCNDVNVTEIVMHICRFFKGRQRRYRGQNPTWIYIRDVWQSWNLFGSGSKFLFYVLLILSTIIGLLIYQSFLNADVTNEQPNASPSEKSVSSTIDSKQCFDGDVCMIPTNYMFV